MTLSASGKEDHVTEQDPELPQRIRDILLCAMRETAAASLDPYSYAARLRDELEALLDSIRLSGIPGMSLAEGTLLLPALLLECASLVEAELEAGVIGQPPPE